MTSRWLASLALAISLVLLLACSRPEAPAPESRVLFVGNSLVYVGNVPAVTAVLRFAARLPAIASTGIMIQ